MSAPLSHKQKRYLAELSDQAWALGQKREERRAESGADAALSTLPSTLSPFAQRSAFRHAEVAKACGKDGLRCCSQDDYLKVKGHFLHLLGRDAAAFQAHVESANDPKRRAEYLVLRACEEGGFRLSYAAAICRTQFKCALEEASEKQLFALLFTLRNRARGRKVTFAKAESREESAESSAAHSTLSALPSSV